MAALTGNKIKDSYLGLLKSIGSGAISSNFVQISDGGGNALPLYLSTTGIRFYDAYTFPSADGTGGQVLTTDASGALSWADSSDNQTLEEVLTAGNTTPLAILSTASGNTFGSTTFSGVATLANNSVVTGTPPTASDNSTKIATTAYVDNQVSTVAVQKTGTITQNAIAVWNNASDTLRSDSSISILTDGTITLSQPNNVPTVTNNYNIGGGNIALNTGGFNTGFGEDNLSQVGFTGDDNSAFGYKASFSMTTGRENTSFGSSALYTETTGRGNIAIGYHSMYNALNVYYSTVIGYESLYSNTTGTQNVALGYQSLYTNLVGDGNTALGYKSLQINTGDKNIAIGYGSGNLITSGTNNVVLGSFSGYRAVGIGGILLYDITTTSNNVVISDGAGTVYQSFDSTGKARLHNYGGGTFTGTLAKTLGVDSIGDIIEVDAATGTVTSVGLSVPTGLTVTGSPITTSGTIALSYTSGYSIPTDSKQTQWDTAYTNRITTATSPLSIATNTISLGTVGVANGGTGATTLTGILVGNGTSAISAVTDGTVSGQVLSTDANGTYSFIDSGTGDVTADGASVVDRVAVWNNTTGELRGTSVIGIEGSRISLYQFTLDGTNTYSCIIGGGRSIDENDFGAQNAGFGASVFTNFAFTGSYNSTLGSFSQAGVTTGNYNTSIGTQSLGQNSTGSYNVGLGASAMRRHRISNYNVAVGYDSMDGVQGSQTTASNYNTAIGHESLQILQGGDNNTVVGYNSGNLITSGSKNVILGSFTGFRAAVVGGLPEYSIIASSNNIVLSDGDGNVRQSFDSNGDATFGGSVEVTKSINLINSNVSPTVGIYQGSNIFQLVGGNNGYSFNNTANTVTRFRIEDSGSATFTKSGEGTNDPSVTIINPTDNEASIRFDSAHTSSDLGFKIGYSINEGDVFEMGRIASNGSTATQFSISSGGLATFSNDIALSRVGRTTIYASRTNQGVQLKSNGTGLLQLNADGGGNVTICENGNDVGIGTPSPTAYLYNGGGMGIYGGTTRTTLSIISNTFSSLYFSKGDGTSSNAGANAYQGYIDYQHSDDSLQFGTAQTERMRISSGGILTKNGDSSSARIVPETDDVGYLGESSHRWQAVYAVNDTIQTSDRNKKTLITTSDLGLDFILKLEPISYKWKVGGWDIKENGKDEEPTKTPIDGKRNHYGLIAQQVKEVIGDKDFGGWVKEDLEDDASMESLRYAEFISPMIKAIQEQQTIIEDLKSRIETLEG